MSLVFYSKPDCHLCDQGLDIVLRLARRHGLDVRKVNIEADPDLFQRHRYRIPVVTLGSVELGWGRLSERALEESLLACQERKETTPEDGGLADGNAGH